MSKLDTKILEAMFNELEPSCSGSKMAGFKGDRKYEFGIDWERHKCALVHISGWHQYSRNHGRFIARSGLILWDSTKKQYIMKRVPSSKETVKDAFDWMIPKMVYNARAKKKSNVVRIGDVYLVRSKNTNLKRLEGTRHRVDIYNTVIVLIHPEHGTEVVEGNWTAYLQKNIATDFGASVRKGD